MCINAIKSNWTAKDLVKRNSLINEAKMRQYRWKDQVLFLVALFLSLLTCSKEHVCVMAMGTPTKPVHEVGQSTLQSTDEDVETRKAIDRAMALVYPALVRIDMVTVEAQDGRLKKYQGAGSGVIISREGHVITNHHVAGKAIRLVCRLSDGEEIEATLVGTDPLADIAILKMKLDQRKHKAKDLSTAQFGDSDKVRVGDTVLAMGSPVSLSQSVTKGIVSNTAMIMPSLFWPFTFKLDGEDVGTLVRWIGHDAPIYGGNSGGPLVNMEGEIIGINEIGIGLGGAIPANLAKSVAKQLIDTGEVKRSWTGLECQPQLKDSVLAKGILVGGVIENSPTAKSGLKPGDIIIEFDGVPVDCRIPEDLPLFNQLILSTPIDKTVDVVAIREDEEKVFTLTTEPRERARGEDEELKSWGITVRNFTLMSALEYQRPDKQGVQINSLRPGGPCTEAKPSLQVNDVILKVNDRPVRNIDELRAITQALIENKEERVPVLVSFERKIDKFLTVVKIGKEPHEEEPILSSKAWLPIVTQVLTQDLAEKLNLKGETGVRIVQVFSGRSVEKAGLKVGDILLKLGGERIAATQPEDTEILPTMIRQYKIGAEVMFDVMRNGEPLKITVELEKPPTPPFEQERYKDEQFEMTVRELSFEDRISQQIGEDVRGVLVERVEHAGWAALAHVALNDILLSINGEPTSDVKTVENILKNAEAQKSKRVVFLVKRGIHTMYLELEPNWENGKSGTEKKE